MTALPHSHAPEIQGLRAVAVGLVLAFHFWPNAVRGGFVGVDVFFVISGYLITGILVRMADGGGISLRDFYARRARRVLPAALVVLAVTFAAMLIVLPEVAWRETAIEVGASALYAENWVLASRAVDYLNAGATPTAAQHYWSLAVEEQFYLVWPLLLIAMVAIGRRLGLSPRTAVLIAAAFVLAASLVVAVRFTGTNPDAAYFVTHARIWELALGGVLAALPRLPAGWMPLRAALASVGLAAILWSAFAFSADTPFPGTAALAPTLGAALVIAAGAIRLGGFRGLDHAVLRYLGDRSYSIYLWHWPLLIFFAELFGRPGRYMDLALVAATLAIAHLSYRFIERPSLDRPFARDWQRLAYGTGSIVVLVLAVALARSLGPATLDQIALHPNQYPGPAALYSRARVPSGVPFLPRVADIKDDRPVVYTNGCMQDQFQPEPITCVLGDPDGTTTVVLFGDSHAAQWEPALDLIAAERGWRLLNFTKSACAPTRVDILRRGVPYVSCTEWRENAVAAILAVHPAMIFASSSRYADVDQAAMVEGFRSIWTSLTAEGAELVVISDTPLFDYEAEDCLSHDPAQCYASRAAVVAPNTLSVAAAGLPHVHFVDMTDGICGPEFCSTVVGNIVAFRDTHHLTASYSRALAPWLAIAAGL